MKRLLLFAALAFTSSTSALATALPVNGGWQLDRLETIGAPTVLSSWTFTLSTAGTFSLTDCCVPGDIWTLSGDIAGVSSFFAGPNDNRANDPVNGLFGTAWTDASFSKFTTALGPGTYTFSVTGDGAGGLPARVGLRVDAVPEPATWAMMLAGFGLVGASMRRRTVRVSFV